MFYINILNMLFFIIFIPFINFIISNIFGRLIGNKGVCFLTTFNIFLNFILLCYFFIYNNENIKSLYNINFGNWFNFSFYIIEWTFLFDNLTFNMFIIVTFISFLVHLYSINYMFDDSHQIRFMGYLSLFTFSMYILITADNFIQLFLGWEGAGSCSYLLISFWYTRISANKSALKAIIINRISDFSLTFGILGLFYIYLSNNFSLIFSISIFYNFIILKKIMFISTKFLTFITLLLYISAVGKSAQIFLHTWLPDAMEGPTPVSALIHAATMVTAGIFLIIRCSNIFELCPNFLLLISIWGAFTSIMAASSGLFLSDIKKIIAYSTCSQLGYMVFICSLSQYNIGLFHLINHAIFKALLSLCAGSIIHSLKDEQDLRNMGQLNKFLPIACISLTIASLAITGIPYITGFYSKDLILENAYIFFGSFSYIVHLIVLFTAMFTAFYSIRILIHVFYIETFFNINYLKNIHEAPLTISYVLFILSIFSIYTGYIIKNFFVNFDYISSFSFFILLKNLTFYDFEFIINNIKLLPLFFTILGIILYIYIIKIKILKNFVYSQIYNIILYFLSFKWYFDNLYNNFINIKIFQFTKTYIFFTIDKGIIEFFGPLTIWKIIKFLSFFFNKIQKGKLNLYLFYISLILIFYEYFLISDYYNFILLYSNFISIKVLKRIIQYFKYKWNEFKYHFYLIKIYFLIERLFKFNRILCFNKKWNIILPFDEKTRLVDLEMNEYEYLEATTNKDEAFYLENWEFEFASGEWEMGFDAEDDHYTSLSIEERLELQLEQDGDDIGWQDYVSLYWFDIDEVADKMVQKFKQNIRFIESIIDARSWEFFDYTSETDYVLSEKVFDFDFEQKYADVIIAEYLRIRTIIDNEDNMFFILTGMESETENFFDDEVFEDFWSYALLIETKVSTLKILILYIRVFWPKLTFLFYLICFSLISFIICVFLFFILLAGDKYLWWYQRFISYAIVKQITVISVIPFYGFLWLVTFFFLMYVCEKWYTIQIWFQNFYLKLFLLKTQYINNINQFHPITKKRKIMYSKWFHYINHFPIFPIIVKFFFGICCILFLLLTTIFVTKHIELNMGLKTRFKKSQLEWAELDYKVFRGWLYKYKFYTFCAKRSATRKAGKKTIYKTLRYIPKTFFFLEKQPYVNLKLAFIKLFPYYIVFYTLRWMWYSDEEEILDRVSRALNEDFQAAVAYVVDLVNAGLYDKKEVDIEMEACRYFVSWKYDIISDWTQWEIEEMQQDLKVQRFYESIYDSLKNFYYTWLSPNTYLYEYTGKKIDYIQLFDEAASFKRTLFGIWIKTYYICKIILRFLFYTIFYSTILIFFFLLIFYLIFYDLTEFYNMLINLSNIIIKNLILLIKFCYHKNYWDIK